MNDAANRPLIESTEQSERRRQSDPDRLALDLDDRLNAIRGYCELAMVKGESGSSLTRRMSAAIDTVDELSSLVGELLARLDRARPAPYHAHAGSDRPL